MSNAGTNGVAGAAVRLSNHRGSWGNWAGRKKTSTLYVSAFVWIILPPLPLIVPLAQPFGQVGFLAIRLRAWAALSGYSRHTTSNRRLRTVWTAPTVRIAATMQCGVIARRRVRLVMPRHHEPICDSRHILLLASCTTDRTPTLIVDMPGTLPPFNSLHSTSARSSTATR